MGSGVGEGYQGNKQEVEMITKPTVDDREFRALLDWYMCSDPWPVEPDKSDSHETITRWLTRECRRRSFNGWVDAYYHFRSRKR